jgi:hypothetical protein
MDHRLSSFKIPIVELQKYYLKIITRMGFGRDSKTILPPKQALKEGMELLI